MTTDDLIARLRLHVTPHVATKISIDCGEAADALEQQAKRIAELERERDHIRAVADATQGIADIDAAMVSGLKAERDALRAEKQIAMGERCEIPGTVHCSCVGFLRAERDALRAKLSTQKPEGERTEAVAEWLRSKGYVVIHSSDFK